MTYVGIDASKDYVDVAVLNQQGKPLKEPERYYNNNEEFDRLDQELQEITWNTESQILIGIESTGIYHLPIHDALVSKGYNVRVFNGLEVSGFRKTRIRKTKTDKIDAKLIANALRFCLEPEKKSPVPNELRNLREFCRIRDRLINKQTRIKNQLTRDLDLIFPGVTNLVKNKLGKKFLAFLERACTPAEVLAMDQDELRKYFPKQKIKTLLNLARKEHGAVDFDRAAIFEIHSLIRQGRFIIHERALVDREIKNEFARIPSVIKTIIGIGPLAGSVILSELGDVSNFDSPKKIVGFAGLDSIIKETGRYRGELKISKCGSKQLRTALFQAAFVGSYKNPVLRAYYQRMRLKGKTHRDAVVCCARKLCHIIYSVLKNNRPFYIPSNIPLIYR